jgi:hypothetical protein
MAWSVISVGPSAQAATDSESARMVKMSPFAGRIESQTVSLTLPIDTMPSIPLTLRKRTACAGSCDVSARDARRRRRTA